MRPEQIFKSSTKETAQEGAQRSKLRLHEATEGKCSEKCGSVAVALAMFQVVSSDLC